MRRALAVLCTTTTIAAGAAVLPTVAGPATATPTRPSPTGVGTATDTRVDNDLHPLAARRNTLRQEAVEQLATDGARLVDRGADRAILLNDGLKVDYPVTTTAQLLTFLIEFGGTGDDEETYGPQAGTIPEPEESDNSTYWKPSSNVGGASEDLGFDRQHFQDMFFDGLPEQGGESFRDLYREMSSGRFKVEGDVSEWVEVDRPEAYYGANLVEDREDPARLAEFVQDGADAWYDAQLADMSPADVRAYLSDFDTWDRYDADHDGDFTEPDGYIDHFQAVHAGVGEEAGGAPWTIWSQRSGASWWTDSGPASSAECSACTHQGGVEIGDSGYYILDYTTEPENGGLGVFAHEFGHDLGLPDYYDTRGGDNSTGFWNLMDSGSWLGHGTGATGTTPNHIAATDKYFLGWYGPRTAGSFADLAEVDGLAIRPQEVVLGPSHHANQIGAQAVKVNLPDGHVSLPGPFAGSGDGGYLYSGGRDNNALVGANSPEIAIPVEDAELTAKVAFQIEPGFDYAFLRASTDGGSSWEDVATDLSVDPTHSDPDNGSGFDLGITGVSGHPGAAGNWSDLTPTWVTLHADLDPYAGQTVRLRWEYYTDGRTLGDGFAVNDVAVGAHETPFTSLDGWTLDGFNHVVGHTYGVTFPQYYIAENRQYRGYDSVLRTGPYSYDYDNTAYFKVDQYPYQDGLLIWYANGFYSDNNTSDHPGGGAALPVDSTPALTWWREDDGSPAAPASGRLQSFDATFDVDRTDPLTLTREVGGSPDHLSLALPARDSIPVFDDTYPFTYLDDGALPFSRWYSTEVAGAGAMIQVISSDESTGRMVLHIGKRFVAPTSQPVLTGTGVVGGELKVTMPTWFQKNVGSAVVWRRDGVRFSSLSDRTHIPQPEDAGHTISAEISGFKTAHEPTVLFTNGIAIAPAAAPRASKPPRLCCGSKVGRVVTTTGAKWPVKGTSKLAWRVGGQVVSTGAKLLLRPAYVGKRLSVTETFTSHGYAVATSTSESLTVAKGRTLLRSTTGPAKHGRAVPVKLFARVLGPMRMPGSVTVVYAGETIGKFHPNRRHSIRLTLPAKRPGRYRLVVTYPGSRGFESARHVRFVRVR